MLRILLIFALFWTAPAVYAQANPDRLNEIQREEIQAKARQAELMAKRESIKKEISKLKSELVRAAADAERFETASRKSEENLAALKREETQLKFAQLSDREAVQRLIGALQRIENNPPPALIVAPADAADAARAAKLMAELSKNLKDRAQIMTARLTELETLRAEIANEQKTLSANEQDVKKRREAVKKLVEEKSKLEKSIAADQDAEVKRMAALALEADTLRELIASVESETLAIAPRIKPDLRPSAKGKKPTKRPSDPLILPSDSIAFAKAKGRLRSPIQGRISKTYSGSHQGITFSAGSQSQVISPYNGRVEFTGPFKNYDNVVILNVGEGYFIVLTGIGDVYAKLNEVVKAGEPLGTLPSSRTQNADLYIELWKDSAPIDPTPWLGTTLAEAG